MKSIQDKTIVVGVAILVLLMAFGVWKFFQVRSAQDDVNALQSNIATLNAEVPKYDAVVAANDAYTAGVARRASVLNSAIDWPVALNTLISITPANAEVQSFNGLANSASTTGGSSGTSGSTTGTSSTSAAIGTISTGITGPGPGLTISAAWITAIAKSPLFANPVQGATVVNPDSTISFPFTISVTPQGSLSQNASLK
jgi:hypothetical protein